MIGSLLAFFEALFTESSSTLGKKTIKQKEESPYSFLTITYFMGALVLLIVSLATKQPFVFMRESIPFFTARVIGDMLLGYVGVRALVTFDRSFFALVRVMTMPLLVLVDITLGNVLSFVQLLSIFGMFFIFLLLCEFKHFSPSRIKIIIPFTVLPVITLSLYKYNITHYNSVFAEQVLSLSLLTLFAFIIDILVYKENPFHLFKRPKIIAQATCAGIAEVAASFAYMFGSASLITALRRAYSLLFSLISDFFVFKKKQDMLTIFSMCGMCILVLLLTFS